MYRAFASKTHRSRLPDMRFRVPSPPFWASSRRTPGSSASSPFARAIHSRALRAVAAVAALVIACDLLFPPPIPNPNIGGSTLVLARDGTPLRAFANASGVWRYPIEPSQVSPLYLEALLGYEDRWFESHPGVNPLALGRAFVQAVSNRDIVSGGSTLTMQVARLIEPIPRSGYGKLKQIVRALQIERRLSKQEILALYLDYAPFGGNIEGVEAASWAYLGKSSAKLSRAEAALLAVLPQAPSRLRPDRHANAAKAARDKVLKRLGDLAVWSPDALAEAQLEPVVTRKLRPPMRAALLAERLRQAQPDRAIVQSTIDPGLQAMAERRLESWMRPLPPRTSAAILVVDNATREVRAYVGSAVFGDAERLGHVDMVQATRSPGSTLKPFLYGLAIDDGLIHSESLLIDAPQDFDGYRPANFGEAFNGPVSAAEALRLSLNSPAVDLIARVSPTRFVSRLSHGGLKLQLPTGAKPNLSVILGGAGASLEQLVGAYVAFAAGGRVAPLRMQADGETASAAARDDDTPPAAPPNDERTLLSDGAAYIVRTMLEAHARPGDSVTGLDLSARRRLAWKTGTSYGFRDAWAIGVTPGYTIGVWVGRPDGTAMPGQYGAVTAAPLLFALVDGLPRHPADDALATAPASVQLVDVCWPSGRDASLVAATACRKKRSAWTMAGVVPPTLPSFADVSAAAGETMVLREVASGLRVRPDCAVGATEQVAIATWPALAEPWLATNERRATTIPALSPNCGGSTAPSNGLLIAGLHPGATLASPSNSHAPPTVSLRALGGAGDVSWLVDGKLVARSNGAQPVELSFDRSGDRKLVAIDSRGRYASLAVTIER